MSIMDESPAGWWSGGGSVAAQGNHVARQQAAAGSMSGGSGDDEGTGDPDAVLSQMALDLLTQANAMEQQEGD